MDFGDALRVLKVGQRVAQQSWPDDVWLMLSCGHDRLVPATQVWPQRSDGKDAVVKPHITMKTAACFSDGGRCSPTCCRLTG